MSLRSSIYEGLTGVTTNCYYQFFPDTFNYKSNLGLVFFLRNAANSNSFDKKEFSKEYQLEIIIQAPAISTIEAKVDAIKSAVYALEGVEISYCTLVEEDDSFDDELKVWQISLVFDISI